MPMDMAGPNTRPFDTGTWQRPCKAACLVPTRARRAPTVLETDEKRRAGRLYLSSHTGLVQVADQGMTADARVQ